MPAERAMQCNAVLSRQTVIGVAGVGPAKRPECLCFYLLARLAGRVTVESSGGPVEGSADDYSVLAACLVTTNAQRGQGSRSPALQMES